MSSTIFIIAICSFWCFATKGKTNFEPLTKTQIEFHEQIYNRIQDLNDNVGFGVVGKFHERDL